MDFSQTHRLLGKPWRITDHPSGASPRFDLFTAFDGIPPAQHSRRVTKLKRSLIPIAAANPTPQIKHLGDGDVDRTAVLSNNQSQVTS